MTFFTTNWEKCSENGGGMSENVGKVSGNCDIIK